jgi:ribonuclease E
VDSAGISRKIEDSKQRDRLKKIADELNTPPGFGVIVRTAGEGQTKADLQRDLRYLLRLWEAIQRSSKETEFPGLVHRERDLVTRTIRDFFTPDIGEVWIDSKDTYERTLAFFRDVMPTKAKTLRLYTGDRPLFNKFNLEEQIESIYKRRVPLPSGGEIIIDGTEALTAIDVNTARSARKGDAEETVLQANLEAAAEIARQLRLRDLGGLVVIDFIDMTPPRNIKKVEKAMRDVMRNDRARYDVTRISKLGLMEIARQRLKGEKMGASYTTCPTCEGYGLVKNVEGAALAALRKLQTRSVRGDLGTIRMRVPSEVAAWLLNQKREDLLQMERRQGLRVVVEADPEMLRHQCQFETLPREKIEEPPALVAPDRAAPPLPPDLKDVPAAKEERASTEDGRKAETEKSEKAPASRKRRRRRRPRSASSETSPQGDGSPSGDANAPAEPAEARQEPKEQEGGATGTKRRRRKRRRRSKSSSTSEEDRSSSGGDDEPVVPTGVSSAELLPAASGGTSSRSGGSRRRGGSSGRQNPRSRSRSRKRSDGASDQDRSVRSPLGTLRSLLDRRDD